MTGNRRAGAMAAVAALVLMIVPTGARAASSLSLAGSVDIEGKRTLTVPVTATCDDLGQETTFIVVTVTQGSSQDRNYVEGQGDVLDVPCNSSAHMHVVAVPITFGNGNWKAGDATVSAIISDCYRESGTLNCTTQAFIMPTTIGIARRH